MMSIERAELTLYPSEVTVQCLCGKHIMIGTYDSAKVEHERETRIRSNLDKKAQMMMVQSRLATLERLLPNETGAASLRVSQCRDEIIAAKKIISKLLNEISLEMRLDKESLDAVKKLYEEKRKQIAELEARFRERQNSETRNDGR